MVNFWKVLDQNKVMDRIIVAESESELYQFQPYQINWTKGKNWGGPVHSIDIKITVCVWYLIKTFGKQSPLCRTAEKENKISQTFWIIHQACTVVFVRSFTFRRQTKRSRSEKKNQIRQATRPHVINQFQCNVRIIFLFWIIKKRQQQPTAFGGELKSNERIEMWSDIQSIHKITNRNK